MSERLANVDRRNGKLIVSSYSKPTGWLWFMNGWFEILDADTDSTALGQVIREALEHSEVGVPKPSREQTRAGFDKPILDALGLRSTSAYMRGARSVAVSEADGDDLSELDVTPKENRLRDGFVEIKEARQQLPRDATPAELAAAVRRALDRATDRPLAQRQ